MPERKMIADAYNELCSSENLELAYTGARKGKTLKPYVLEFEENIKENLLQLHTELLMQTYKPQPLKTFIIRDPKTRKISKSAFRDRIVHHAICNIIEPLFDKRFIHDSYANRIGKGTLAAIERFDCFKRKASKNNTRECYVLKADIKSYFDTVDHNILLEILARTIKDERIMWLIRQVLANHKTETKNKGMPLGNLTSQFFANVYLDELDQFVKHTLKAKYYIRYVDDFVILHPSKAILAGYREKINRFLTEKLDLKLHPDKSKILRLDNGINFLGFRIFYHHKLLAGKNLRRFKNKLKDMKYCYHEGIIEREETIERLEGWLAYAKYANTYRYRKTLLSRFNADFPIQQDIKITSAKKHENFNKKIDYAKIEPSHLKTLQLIKKGLPIKDIAARRCIKESTVWQHFARLAENHHIHMKEVIARHKIKKILAKITSVNDTLKDIKERIDDETITYDEINVVLANLKGKHRKKSISYFCQWYLKTNCLRKCYDNERQRKECKAKIQQLCATCPQLQYTKTEFLYFFLQHTTICQLPEKDKNRFMSWGEFKARQKKMSTHSSALQSPISGGA